VLRVGLVQASIRQDEKWDVQRLVDNFESHVALTRRAAAQGARLVVWPESAVPWGLDETPQIAERMSALARETGAYLVFGNDDREPQPSGRERVYVGAKMIDPAGRLVLRYHKVRLVPFGEYVPLQPLLTLGGRVAARLVRGVSDFTPGSEASVGDAHGRRVGVSICYEAIFPDYVRRFAAGGAVLLLNVTNDAWYGTTSAPYQHFAMAVFRAVENGRYLARAANTGISAFVDPRGRVLEKSALFERTVLVRDVPEAALQTFYSRHGDVFAWSCLAVAAALGAGALRGSR
jgi:apolipoprotein N-acyltransferase